MEVSVEPSNNETSSSTSVRRLGLTKGGDLPIKDEHRDHPFIIQNDPQKNLARTIISDEAVAIGYYLHLLETNGVQEQQAMDALDEHADVNMAEYHEWVQGLTARERRLRLVDLLEWRTTEGGDWAAEVYLEDYDCTFRSTGLDSSSEKLAANIQRNVELEPSMCYRTAQKAAMLHNDNHRVAYFEGRELICGGPRRLPTGHSTRTGVH